MANTSNYTEENIKSLDWREHIRLRPGMYIGKSGDGSSPDDGIYVLLKEIIDNYFKSYPKLKEYMSNQISYARENGYVETILKRKRFLPEINSRNAILRSSAERNAINTPVQGSAADIIKLAMIKIDSEIEKKSLKSKLILQVHDELVFDVHLPELNIVKEIVSYNMENAIQIDVPLKVDIGYGDNWLVAH